MERPLVIKWSVKEERSTREKGMGIQTKIAASLEQRGSNTALICICNVLTFVLGNSLFYINK